MDILLNNKGIDTAVEKIIRTLIDSLPEDSCNVDTALCILDICRKKLTEDIEIPSDVKRKYGCWKN